MLNRKLISPSLTDLKEQATSKPLDGQKRRLPPEMKNAEQYCYLEQITNKTSMVVTLMDREKIVGIIEWYHKTCNKVNRDSKLNVLIPKQTIKLYTQRELGP